MNTSLLRRRLARWIAAFVGVATAAAGFLMFSTSANAAVDTDAWYVIVNEHSGLAIDIQGRSQDNGATALLWTRTDASNQQFRFVDAGSGYYSIEARHSGKALDVYARSTENGADVVQWTDNGGTNQQWQLNEQSDGSYEIVNRNSEKALDNWEGATDPGTRLSQYDRNDTTVQRWSLVPVDGGGGGGQAGDGSLSDPNLQYYGRWADDGNWRTMGWAGGYVESAFTGSSIGVRLRNTIDMYYSVDGAPEQWMRNVSGNVTVASGLGAGSHTIRIGFRERAGSYNGDPAFGGFILASGEQTSSNARPADFIEFIGDSITVGQPNGDRPFTAYGYLVGEALGAGHTQVAQGGACLVSQDCYGMMDWFRRSSGWVDNDDWDFSTYQATAVVINLGTNDIGHGVSTTQFYENYIVMLERVRQAYPDAEIFAMGVFRNRYVTETRNAVEVRNNAGDAKVHFVDTAGWVDPETDTWDNVHPTDEGQQKIANLLTPIIDQYL
ncbi:RICIN domain-containing protein [Glycomyces sp. L485]|uniref:RICIN domain-containing protein n=1 Tax=Glycomyces sp. L485 TaxID=2909235 RepID=UPI001F4BC32F|nr:RICIN domain-containing protein [Glycomyces sp. L485]MCH7232616.1 RICIN domain-containing protein [Glycomyces sp. L485]